MCGVAGYIFSSSLVSDFNSSAALLFIGQRGPDASGVECESVHGHSVTLLHSRLSIIDLTVRARQPMRDRDSNWLITYNGEIFNYL